MRSAPRRRPLLSDYADPALVAERAEQMSDDQLMCYGLTKHPWKPMTGWVEDGTNVRFIRFRCTRCKRGRISAYGFGVQTKHRYLDAPDDDEAPYGVRNVGGVIGADGREAVRMVAVDRVIARFVPKGASEPTPITAARGRRRKKAS